MIFKQLRIGQYGKIFWVYKIRTIKDGKYLKFGKFLRKHKLDEVLQIINILKREMNIFGPRPEELKDFFSIPFYERKILFSVKPGLLSLATLYFLNRENMSKNYLPLQRVKAKMDILYLQNRTFYLDLKILCKALLKLLKI